MVAPSDMDGRVRAIREMLDANGHYTAPDHVLCGKIAWPVPSVMRPVLPVLRRPEESYQMDFHNSREGIKEALMDVEESRYRYM